MRERLQDRIRLSRRRKGWSQAQLGVRLGVTASAVGHWERPAGHVPCLSRLLQLSELFDVELGWLVSGGEQLDGNRVRERLGPAPACDEQFVLDALGTLPPDARRMVLGMLRAVCATMVERPQCSRHQANGALARYLGLG
ncbi:helix-turn-helix transcriptional regulator [Luteimonas sp. MC1750]|uniref:helix-turn-helix transcriptional regulator n=1 Tax=Luteimonas sp. MC1750 TaxID=2799326 RepID=UPI0018F06569|nr:helix-turn-helix transcriptional regulator [Luteimonas sp. MC1750]MBJ6984501.1 helix-turn-helix transcriptional regulator [Luteimonas sp. MC1750]QQO04887.1 helix-turn-helix transcriptional regulator [Luteimonas sp. MC1750]